MLQLLAHQLAEILNLAHRLDVRRRREERNQARRVEEADRHRMAQDLHGEVGQALTALIGRIRWAMTQPQVNLLDLQVFETAATNALDATRALAVRLRIEPTHDDPLAEARRYAETVLALARCALSWVDQRADFSLPYRASREIGRVIRESITNVVRHAGADAVEIRLETPDNLVRASVRDNGRGFSPQLVHLDESGRGFGLMGNRERVEQIGGSLTISSSPGRGTLIVVEVPRRGRLRASP
jgi:signal transduction histidine kinase